MRGEGQEMIICIEITTLKSMLLTKNSPEEPGSVNSKKEQKRKLLFQVLWRGGNKKL